MREFAPSARMLAPVAAVAGVLALVGVLVLEMADDWQMTRGLGKVDALARIRAVAGPGAVACGLVSRTEPIAPMADCVAGAAAGRLPFWAIHQLRHREGLDDVWYGFVRDGRGRLYAANYDRHRTLFFSPCRRLRSTGEPQRPFECEIAHWKRKL